MITFNNTREITNKWPAMIVKGDSVTPRQAAEIIIKTDQHFPNFKYAGNDSNHAKALNQLCGVDNGSGIDYWGSLSAFREKYGILNIGYLNNDRIVSSYIDGPHGWCDWDGTIYTASYNIGKWPSVQHVAEEWQTISEAFPYLKLTCQLFDHETCEEDAIPVVNFIVSEGRVIVEDAEEPLDTLQSDINIDCLAERIQYGSCATEHGITISDLKKKLEDIYVHVPQFKLAPGERKRERSF